MRPTRLVDPAARQRLEATITEGERRSAGEIVLVIVRACDEYGSAGWRLGVVLAVLAFSALAAFAPQQDVWRYLAAQALALAAGHALARVDALRRRLLPQPLVEQRVAERARRAFAENGLARTQQRTGILVFVALLEHRVVVLADAGVHGRLDPNERGQTWEEVVDLAVAGLRAGRAVEGLDAALRRCGEILAATVPAPDHNPDELPNRVVLED
jgi:putative membrane protein